MSTDMKYILKAIVLSAVLFYPAASMCAPTPLLDDWQFCLGADTNGVWSPVAIPHDWAIAGPFDREIDKQTVAIEQNGETTPTEKTGRSGSLPWIGEGWYRRTIEIPQGVKYAALVFEGAMAEPEVFLDGRKVGEWKYGYTPFVVDLSGNEGEAFELSGKHEIIVHCRNVAESSRWYPGAGLYRHVSLLTGGEAGIEHWGVSIRTPTLQTWEADVELRNPGNLALCVTNYVLEGSRPYKSWSPEEPNLYTLVTEVRSEDDSLLDRAETRFGFRTIEFGADGFKLNGQKRKFKGACLHHDLGPIGAAFNESAFRRQLRKLKWIGCDSIRTSHNHPSPRQLEICDEMGFMVMAESFDMWEHPKCKKGYARFFRDWWRKDLASLVKVCRSHPSVVMYSIGNEIPEQSRPKGLALVREMQDFMHSLDSTRPCTQGLDRWPGAIQSGVAAEMDITGANYRLPYYEEARKVAKNNIVLGSETASTVSSRGCYPLPVVERPMSDDERYDDGQCPSWDTRSASWSNLPDDDRAMQEDNDWVIGEFVWSGFDYLGEPSPYDTYWPSRSSYFGIFDLAGLPKDRAWLYRSYWNPGEPTLHILPHWNWREGDIVSVYVYTDAPSAELFINGKSQGVRTKDKSSRLDRFRLRWNDIAYERGEVKVVTCDGRTATMRTAGEPKRIAILPDDGARVSHRAPVKGATPDLAFFEVSIVDADGSLCPDATLPLSVEVSGAARFKGICNGDATSLETFTEPRMTTFHGKLTIVTEPISSGIATLTVKTPSLPDAVYTFEILPSGSIPAANPLTPEGAFLSDPAPRVGPDDILRVFGSRDEFGASELYCSHWNDMYETDNMLSWRIKRGVFSSTGEKDGVPGSDAVLWAPDAIFLDGQWRLFYCMPDKSHREGVASAPSPEGPFKSDSVYSWAKEIDPSLFLNDDGKLYYTFGQISMKMCELKRDLSGYVEGTLRDGVITEESHGFHEGSQPDKGRTFRCC